MTNPFAAPEWEAWPTATAGLQSTPGVDTATRLRTEISIAGFVTAYSVILGAVMGLVWPRVAPHVAIVQAARGSEVATKALLGDDMWFGLLGVIAGVVSVAVVLLVARDAGRGPGALVGLTAGGVLGSLVAVHIGHQIQHPHLVTTLHAVPGITHREITTVLSYFDFTVRAHGVLLAWPLAAVVMHAVALIVRYLRLGPEA
jgi:hypothetical protein